MSILSAIRSLSRHAGVEVDRIMFVMHVVCVFVCVCVFFLQAEDGIRDLVRSRGLGDVYKRQTYGDER